MIFIVPSMVLSNNNLFSSTIETEHCSFADSNASTFMHNLNDLIYKNVAMILHSKALGEMFSEQS